MTYDRNQNMLIDKAKAQNKIDPIAALMNAYTIAGDNIETHKIRHDQDYFISDKFSF